MYKNMNIDISEKVKILADSGFQGIKNLHVNSEIPHKKSKSKPLTDSQKAENKRQASKRVIIEHVNREFKIFKICGSKYRGKHKNYQSNWELVAAIINLKKSTRHLVHASF
jgi:DDE superfamily endonuclease